MPTFRMLLRALTTLLVAGALLMVVPVTSVGASTGNAAATTVPSPRTRADLRGDRPSSSARRGRAEWKGTSLYYYESIPAKWDWSLSTAVAKWNGSGGHLKLVRTTQRTRAQLVIGYGDTGGAAAMATVGAMRGAWVHLSPTHNAVDAVDAYNRVTVMAVFAHELGHVLGFQHTTAACSLMLPVLDVDGCNLVPRSRPGYYRCRTIDGPLVADFVRLYGGRASQPGDWCLIDPLPIALSGVTFSGGDATGAPVTIRWGRPAATPVGARVRVRRWQATTCGAAPSGAETTYRSPGTGFWQDATAKSVSSACFEVQLVNRYGAGRPSVARVLTRWAGGQERARVASRP